MKILNRLKQLFSKLVCKLSCCNSNCSISKKELIIQIKTLKSEIEILRINSSIKVLNRRLSI
jgi:hypothetical protein